ncbi:MAG TPA: molybdate ABC transporter substrate-binding protein [Stellaceae bacterium]|nr:molybdate ABC transporter substrate-binding protein [Stellaceae bacterium]
MTSISVFRQHLRRAGLALLLGVMLLAPAPAFADDVLVFAAASLKNALDDAVTAFDKSGASVKVSYAASSALAKQIENGAPADIFISADLDWMNEVAKHNLIQPATRKDLLGNVLVLVAPADSKANVEIKPGFPLAKLLGDGHLAMADPAAVPAGKYGKAALEKLGVWSAVESRVAPAEDVRAALLYVSRKEAPYGIVYQTDAAADKGVRVAGTFPPDTYPPIIYPIALTATSKKPDAKKLLAFLESPEARPFFEKQGFSVLK